MKVDPIVFWAGVLLGVVIGMVLIVFAPPAWAHPGPESHNTYEHVTRGHIADQVSSARLAQLRDVNGPYAVAQPRTERTARAARTPRVAPRRGPYGEQVERWRPLVARWFPGEVDVAMCVMRHESSGDPNAKNPASSAAGLWQFLRSTWNRAAAGLDLPTYGEGGPYDPEDATRAAAWLRARGSGWGQWTAAGKC